MAENFFDKSDEEIAELSKNKEFLASMDTDENSFDALDRDLSAREVFALNVGRGMAGGVRGMENLFNMMTGSDTTALTDLANIPTKEQEERAFAPLESSNPLASTLGELAGEIAITTPVGGAVGNAVKPVAGALKAGATVSRFAPVVAAGATEGAIIGADEDAAGFGALLGGGAAGIAEAALPPIARRLKRYFGKAKPLGELVEVSDGVVKPTKETVEVLDEVGVNFDDIAREAQDEILNPKQAAVKGAFAKEGIEPASRTRIRPNVQDIQREGFLLRQTGDDGAASAFRQRVVNENEAIKNRFSQLADEFGVTGEEGANKLRNSLFDIQSNMRSARNRAYQDLAEVSKGNPELVNRIPLNTNTLINGVREASEVGLDDSTEKAVVRAFEDFGLVEKGQRSGGLDLITGDTPVDKLTLANLNRFRARINNAFDSTKPKEVVARGRIIKAIDDIEEEVVNAFDDAGFSGADTPKVIQDAAKRARQSVIDEKKVFNQNDVIEKLVSPKRAGLNAKESPLVAASKTFDKIFTKSTPVEDVRKLVNTLSNQGSDESLEAIGNLQASTMLNLLDSAVKPSSKLVDESGTTVNVFSGAKLNRRIEQIGEDKIRAIFKNNPEALKSLARLRKIGNAMITPEEAVQKGSLPPGVLNTVFDTISKTKGVPVVGAAADVGEKIQTGAASRKVTSFKPSEDDMIDFILFEGNPRLQKMLEAAGKYNPSADVAAVSAASSGTEQQK